MMVIMIISVMILVMMVVVIMMMIMRYTLRMVSLPYTPIYRGAYRARVPPMPGDFHKKNYIRKNF